MPILNEYVTVDKEIAAGVPVFKRDAGCCKNSF